MLFNRLHRIYAVWFQISDFAFYNEFTFSFRCHGFQAFAILSDPKLPLNNIFLCGLASNNTTCACVYKYFERLPHNAPDDRNPITLKYKTTDKIVLWAKISCSSCDPDLSVHDNVNHHQDSTRDQHVNTSLDHS